MREHRVLIVAGEDADERVTEFSSLKEVPPYVLYRVDDTEKLKNLKIKEWEEICKNPKAFNLPKEYAEEQLQELKTESDDDFYADLVAGYETDEDGNAISRMNPDGKFIAITRGGSFAQPFLLKDGTTSYSAKKSDIDWAQIHMNPEFVNLYERTWEMCVEGLEPVSDVDKQVYENMKNKQDYFENFKDKEEYVTSCSSFWAFAFLNDLDIWLDADDCPVSQFEWMSTYYDRFIRGLPDDTTLTIFEYITD